LLVVVIFVAINIAASSLLTNARIDLTENGQFTLADGTRNVVASLKEPITLKFFFSKKVAADYAQTSAYAKRVLDMLQEYQALSRGNIVLEEIDPEPFTPEEDEASAHRHGRTGLFRTSRHKSHRWTRDGDLLFSRARAVSRI
jgi:ABC-type uncharacterized transport system involved in gliding motility auxiliary subunit